MNLNFDDSGLNKLGIHWGQYLATLFTTIFVVFFIIYLSVPKFKILILQIISFLNCSGFNCNGA